ncbi:LacI family DNA-binding transcriptional regulator [Nocardioides marmotae]|uniref:LacI family DNA-binding transcriptional regulator n=1 Tax=Nocardioides marmotae TaxID=2663857 RepID=UPI00132BD7FE|nr:LacI family DNA-binding transcriptional regulator [Nocardioides marmotae]MBC9735277.1 LacI family DNA-binding transcriptional regulator [Nocardioides marmotae]MTB86377.1 LacI family DNA-binding transcriptional regulator [Nocardioides marmotae]
MDAPGTPTLDEVARLAGVSRATASRAINGGSRVSDRARAAVEAAVRSLGYTPNPAARTLATRRTDSVAVVVPEPDDRVFSDPFFGRTLTAVNRVLAERDLQLVLLLARPGEEEGRTLRYLRNGHVDGALVVSHHRSDHLAEHLGELGLPCAFVGRPILGADRVAWADTDNVAGARLATELLLERGCRRIGHVAGPSDMAAGQDRLAGFLDALPDGLSGGLPEGGAPVEHGDFTEASGEAACARLLAAHPDLDGLFVASDLMARGALRALAAAGRSVPGDVAVVGYDDLGADHCTPPLTTVVNPAGELAERATRLMLARLDGSASGGESVLLPPRLVRRASA